MLIHQFFMLKRTTATAAAQPPELVAEQFSSLLHFTLRPDPLVFSSRECIARQLTMCVSRLVFNSGLGRARHNEPFNALPPFRIGAIVSGRGMRVRAPPLRRIVLTHKGATLGLFSIAAPVLMRLGSGNHAAVRGFEVRSLLLRAPSAASIGSFAPVVLPSSSSVPLGSFALSAASLVLGCHALANSGPVIFELRNAIIAVAHCILHWRLVCR